MRADIKVTLIMVTAATLFLAGSGGADSRACDRDPVRIPVFGSLSAAPADGDGCQSPLDWCTLGDLRGILWGQFDFTMLTVAPAQLPEAPMISFYTGQVVITTRGDKIFGLDAGTIDLSPVGPGPYSSVVTVTGGEGRFAGASGYILISGTIDWQTGEAVGRYRGELTIP